MGTPHARSPNPTDGFWVFAYGSLMWRPGFAAAEIRKARLDGYKRAFALSSLHYRGNEAFPGLVLGLDWDPAVHCKGMALRVSHDQAHEVRHYLAERELVSRAYFEVRHPVTLLCPGGGAGPGEGARVEAICYILDRTHPQYSGGMSLEDQAAIICRAEGSTGTNRTICSIRRCICANWKSRSPTLPPSRRWSSESLE